MHLTQYQAYHDDFRERGPIEMRKHIVACLALTLALVLTLSCVSLAEGFTAYNPPIVETTAGKLRGFMNGSTYVFRGIQYAQAKRFMAPEPVDPWEGVKDAQTYGPVSPVLDATPFSDSLVNQDEFVWPHRYWVQDENCLNLNVWTQHLDKDARKPVIVFFHGGGFDNGSSIEAYAYDGNNLSVFGDVVVVTVNHRLNVFGMLDLSAYGEQYKGSANNTMKDLIASLTWIHENIESFGGDPNNVMVFGQSGGSTKTALLYHIPAAEGLFHKAAAHSSGNITTMEPGDSARIAQLVLEKFGIAPDEVEKLNDISARELMLAGYEARDQVSKELGRNVRFRPTYDEDYITTEFASFSNDYPMMIGSVWSERIGTLHKGTGKNEWADAEVEAKLTEVFGEDKDEIMAEFTRLFPEKKRQDVLYYDAARRGQVRDALAARMKGITAPVYAFLFAYEAPVNGGITPFHCSELTYVFHNAEFSECRFATGASPEALKVQDTMARAWINFAYTGNPSQEGLEWLPYNETSNNGTMVFDTNSAFTILDDQKLCELMLKHM